MIQLTLIRHGVTDWNVEKRYLGSSDIPLNATGHQQADAIAGRLAGERIHAVISSDLGRAWTMAQAIADANNAERGRGLSVKAEPGLRESAFGMFEGLRYKDVIAQHLLIANRWFADVEQPPPGGERLSVVAARVAAARDRLVAAHPNKRLVLVGHSGSLRLLVCALLGLPAAEYWRFNIDPGSLSQVNLYPGGAILVRLNDICHLGDGVEDEGDGDAESE